MHPAGPEFVFPRSVSGASPKSRFVNTPNETPDLVTANMLLSPFLALFQRNWLLPVFNNVQPMCCATPNHIIGVASVHQVTIDRVPNEGKSVPNIRDERHPASEPNAGLAHHHGGVHREEHRREQGHAHHWFGECSFVPIAWGETTANVHNRLREPSARHGTARMRPAPDGRSTSPATSSRPAPTAGPSRRR